MAARFDSSLAVAHSRRGARHHGSWRSLPPAQTVFQAVHRPEFGGENDVMMSTRVRVERRRDKGQKGTGAPRHVARVGVLGFEGDSASRPGTSSAIRVCPASLCPRAGETGVDAHSTHHGTLRPTAAAAGGWRGDGRDRPGLNGVLPPSPDFTRGGVIGASRRREVRWDVRTCADWQRGRWRGTLTGEEAH